MRTRQRLRDRSAKPGQTLAAYFLNQRMHRLTRHTVTASNVGDRRTIAHHLEHCLIALLHKIQLHEHRDGPPATKTAEMPPAKG